MDFLTYLECRLFLTKLLQIIFSASYGLGLTCNDLILFLNLRF
jgi:hypothetical protein